MKERQAYWLHRGSGLVWAVEIAAGKVTACAGPLAREDAIPLILDYVAYRASSDAMWVQSHRDEFTDLLSEGPSPSPAANSSALPT